MVGEEWEVARGVGVGENVDCSAECDMECTVVTSGGEIYRYFISPIGVSSGRTPWVDRRSAEIIRCHYLHY